MDRSKIIWEIVEERLRQDALKESGRFKFTLADNPGMTDDQKLHSINEECAEIGKNLLARAGLVTDGDPSPEALRKEIIQVAALSLAWLESL